MNNPRPFDERRDIIIPGDIEKTIEFCVSHFIQLANKAIKDHGAFFVALSGGSTPKAIFNKLASEKYRSSIDWEKVYLFWSDERSVGPNHEESNYNMAMKAGFDSLAIPKDHIFRMKAETDIDKHALEYEHLIKDHVENNSFDLIMLGMGEDGHTASLFPHTQALKEHSRLVVSNFIPEKNTWRMTMTFPCINKAKTIAIYVLGSSKANRVKEILSSQQTSYPVALVGTKTHKALWIMDSKASHFIS